MSPSTVATVVASGVCSIQLVVRASRRLAWLLGGSAHLLAVDERVDGLAK